MAKKSKGKASADARETKKAAPREPAQKAKRPTQKEVAAASPAVVPRDDIRALQDAVAELRRQTAVLDELARVLRKQVKRLKKAKPARPGRAKPDASTIDDGAPSRPLARAIGAIRRGVQSTRDRVTRR